MINNVVHRIGEGVVVKDKDPDSAELRISPTEHVTDITTDLNKFKDKKTNTYQDAAGKDVKLSTDRKSYITATWTPLFSPNRVTAPDLVMGERVDIWQVGRTDKYYWTVSRGTDDLRNLEEIIYIISNKTDHKETLDESNTIKIVISSKDQRLYIHTPKNRKEPTEMLLDFDYGKGRIRMTNTADKYMLFDPANDIFKVKMPRVVFDCDDFLVTGESVFQKDVQMDKNLHVSGRPSTGSGNIKGYHPHNKHWF